MTDNEIDRLKTLCSKLLREVQLLGDDQSDSNLPEWEREAERLGVQPWDWTQHPIV
jgi:hypothetical protein